MVDMRWGGRDESTDDHLTTAICLEELDHCKRVSVGPSFCLLVGQKYGYRPLPHSLAGDQFEHMVQGLESLNMGAGVKLLRQWYVKERASNEGPFIIVDILLLAHRHYSFMLYCFFETLVIQVMGHG